MIYEITASITIAHTNIWMSNFKKKQTKIKDTINEIPCVYNSNLDFPIAFMVLRLKWYRAFKNPERHKIWKIETHGSHFSEYNSTITGFAKKIKNDKIG